MEEMRRPMIIAVGYVAVIAAALALLWTMQHPWSDLPKPQLIRDLIDRTLALAVASRAEIYEDYDAAGTISGTAALSGDHAKSSTECEP
jgi:hypothetical protein